MQEAIPFNNPLPVGNELTYVATASQNLGSIEFAARCESELESRLQSRQVLLTPSGTAALELAAMLCDLERGDEVILPSFTFVSTANAFVRCGAKPVFVDIRPDTLNLDEELLEKSITPRTRAVIPVHYAGVSCEMDRISAIATKYGLKIVEDAAMALNAGYRTQSLGTIGMVGCFSFHYTKNCIAGQGGAISVNSPDLAKRAVVIRDKGTNRRDFFSGLSDKYNWVALGSNFHISELNAAFLYGQLEKLDEITQHLRRGYQYYLRELQPLEAEGKLQLPIVPDGCTSNFPLFQLILPNPKARNELIEHLRQKGIQSVFHYVPLHSSPMGQELGYRPSDLPVTERISSCLTRLPLFGSISLQQQSRVVDEVFRFFSRQREESHSPYNLQVH